MKWTLTETEKRMVRAHWPSGPVLVAEQDAMVIDLQLWIQLNRRQEQLLEPSEIAQQWVRVDQWLKADRSHSKGDGISGSTTSLASEDSRYCAD